MSFTPETLLRHWQTLCLIPRYPRKITAGELCQQLSSEGFSVGKRTIERDLQALSRIFPLAVDDREKPFGWSWNKEAHSFDLPSISTSKSLTLLMAREYLRAVIPISVYHQLTPYFCLAEQKLSILAGHVSLADWQGRVRIISPTQPLLAPEIDEVVEANIHEALLLNRQCRIGYLRKDGKTDKYPINLLGLVQRGPLVYLICTIKTYNDIRILALHRIKSACLLDIQATHPSNFDLDEYLASGAFGWGNGNSINMIAMFLPEAGNHLYETPLSQNQSIEVQPDGRLKVTATISDTEVFFWWLLGFGAGVEVLEPKTLRERLRDSHIAAVGIYQ